MTLRTGIIALALMAATGCSSYTSPECQLLSSLPGIMGPAGYAIKGSVKPCEKERAENEAKKLAEMQRSCAERPGAPGSLREWYCTSGLHGGARRETPTETPTGRIQQ